VRGRYGATMTVLAAAALGIALYLTWTKLNGEAPACGPLHGCETVNSSPYSEFLGIPVALYGSVGAALILVASLAWWRTADRRALYAAYGLGLIGLPVIVYLVYLELAVIHAVCVWCAGFAVALVAGWIVATVALSRSGRPGPP
jgi:uncharacterized membrane protein